MKLDLRAYRPAGLLALRPEALGQDFPGHASDGRPAPTNGVAIVRVEGPLVHGWGGFFMCYEEILANVKAAADSDAHTIVMRIDSPGGDVAGVLDTARELRKVAAANGKRLLAYTDGVMASAAYALGCAAEEITISATACIGSIGVIEALVDITEADRAQGIQWTLVTSGKLKGTGNPHATLSDAGAAEVQQHVDDMAAEFFEWVQEARGFDPAPLEAAVRVGKRAIGDKLADKVASWSDFLTYASQEPAKVEAAPLGATVPAMSLKAESDAEAAKKYLKKMAESEDEVESKRAKRALDAMDSEDPDKDGDKDKASAEDEEKKASAEDEEKKDKAEDDKDAEAKANASLAKSLAAASQRIATLEATAAKAAKAEESAKRDAIFAARPDLSPELRESLKDLPAARVKAIVDGIPKGKFAAGTPAARPAQDSAGAQAPGLGASMLDDMSVRMGLVKTKSSGVAWDGVRFQLGVPEIVPAAKDLK